MKINFYCNHALYFFLVFGIFQVSGLKAQRACSQNLATARNLFNGGRFYEIENTLDACIKNGFTKQERIEALRLLSLTYLYLDKYPNADSTYLTLLRINPEYRTNPAADPPDLVFLDESFRHKPIFKWTVNAGLNLVFPRLIYDYSVLQNPKTSWSHKSGYNFGAGLEFDLYKNLSIAVDAIYCLNLYDKNYSEDPAILGINHYELQWISAPVYLKYYLGTGKIKPYAMAGGSASYLLKSRYSVLTRKGTSSSTSGEVNNSDISLAGNFKSWNYVTLIGLGVSYKTTNIYSFALEVTYGAGIKNVENENKIFGIAGDKLQESPIYFDASIPPHRLDQVTVTLKFINPVYNPKKLKGK
jgi:hypothetical protein